MTVGTFLSGFVDAAAIVLDEGSRFAELAIFLDGQGLDAAAAVIGQENVPAVAVGDEMAGAGAAGRLLVQLGKFAGRIDGEGGDAAGLGAVADLVDGVEEFLVGMNGE